MSLLDDDGGGSGTKTLNKTKSSSTGTDETGVKIIDLNKYSDSPYKTDSYKSNTQLKIGVVLTKQPISTVTIEIQTPENPDVNILNPEILFTPENWNTPQQIRLGNCFSTDSSLRFIAKASAEGGFTGAEKDEITVIINQQESCTNSAKILAHPRRAIQQNQSTKPHRAIQFLQNLIHHFS